MRVLHVFDSIHPHAGGAQHVMFLWLEELRRRGIDVLLVCDAGIHQVPHTLSDRELCIVPSISLGGVLAGRGVPLYIPARARQRILDFHPDVIHLHEQVFVSQRIMAFAQTLGIPIIHSFHQDPNVFVARNFPASVFVGRGKCVTRLLERAQLVLLRGATLVTVPTAAYMSFVTQKTTRPIHHLHYPVERVFFPQKKKSPHGPPKRCITVSRLVPEKKIEVLLHAFSLLESGMTLTVVGDGPDRQRLQGLAQRLGISDSVTWLGWVSHERLSILHTEHDLFLSASTMETLGLVYIEALLCGLPCIVADYPVSREVVPHSGGVFVSGDEPAVWADALRSLRTATSWYEQLAQGVWEGRQQLGQYHPEQSTTALHALYQHCVDAPS